MARPYNKRVSPPDRDGDGTPGGSLPGNKTVPEAIGPAPINNTVTNCIPGTRLHLESGAVLAFGESAEVSFGEAAFLRERGQAE